MVCDMLREHDERDGDIRDGDGTDIGADAPFRRVFGIKESAHKGKFGHPFHRFENRKVDNTHLFRAGDVTEPRKDRRERIPRKDADDERDHLHHFFAVDGTDDGDCKREQCADEAEAGIQRHDITACTRVDTGAAERVLNGAARQRKSDQCNRRPDDRRRHDFIDPFDAHAFDDNGDDDVHESREHGADDQSQIPQSRGNAARKRRRHRADKRERTAKEHGTAEFGEKLVHERARTRRRNGHPVADNHRHGDRCRKNREQLLQREQDQLPGLRSVFYAIDQFHW